LEEEKIKSLVKDFDLKQNILKKYILDHIEGEDIIEKARDFINALKHLGVTTVNGKYCTVAANK